MSIILDGQSFEIDIFDNNIIDVANRANITIPAPCYRNKQRKGCCHGCVVEIDGEQKYACSTKPIDGMNVVIDRTDLKEIRKKAIKEYNDATKNSKSDGCGCSE